MRENKPPVLSGNLPVTILPTFNCDQLALIFGVCLVDGVFVVDSETGHLVAANQKLLELLGHGLSGLEDADVSFDRLVHPEDRGLFNIWRREGQQEPEVTFEARLLTVEGGVEVVEIMLKNIRWQRREYQLGFVRPCNERHARELQLKDQAELQKGRALEALKSSLRVYELNEKIKSTLVLTTKLLNADNEDQLFREALHILTSEDGLNYMEATFLVLEEGELKIVCSTRETAKKVFPLNDDNKYSRCVRKGFSRNGEDIGADQGENFVPLRSRELLLGLVAVKQHPREKEFFDEYKQIGEWQGDMLVQIGDIIALLLDNLRLNRELKRQSIVDPLTGAFNRNFFMSRLNSEVHRASRHSRPVSLVFVDVDHFKQINDLYGHLQGDAVLRELGHFFRSSLRDTDVVCRYGGDEFVILLPEATAEMAQATAEKLIHTAAHHRFSNLDSPDQALTVTISVGISTLRPGQDEEQFLQSADSALYRAKKDGRNRVAVNATG
jgi:diguanylate cyclase (GGDEF)-like protein/PAS domain S-box-containing protein